MELKNFQHEGVRFLCDRSRALLADQMGLGKSAQVIRALDCFGNTSPLIVCPAIAREHWRRQFDLWGMQGHWPVIVSYDEVRTRLHNLNKERWSALIIDEVHFTKNMKARRTQAVWGKIGVARQAQRIWALSGTPAPNHYGELYPMLKACGRWKGTYDDFIARFCCRDDMGKVVGNRMEFVDELRDILGGFMLRRHKRTVAPDLPPISVRPWYVKPDPELLDIIRPVDGERLWDQARQEERALKDALSKLRPAERMPYLAETMPHYATWRRVSGILKTPAVLDTVLFEMENQLMDKVVIYAYHRDPIVLLRDLLKAKGINVAAVWGGTSDKKKTAAQDKFKRWHRGVFIGQIQAAGTAIDLTSAHHGIMLEKDWVPGNNAQAMERMHRWGQEHPVTIRDVTISGGVDEIVSATLDRKMRELSALFD